MEKNLTQCVLPAIILGAALVMAAYLLAGGIKEYGRSIERAAVHQPPPVVMPDKLRLSFESGNSPVRIEQQILK